MVPTATYEAALKRAIDEGLYIRDYGADQIGTYWQVVNPKYSDGWYTVRIAESGRALTCNCTAGRRGTYCKHRAFVHDWETARRQYEGSKYEDDVYDRMIQQRDREEDARVAEYKYQRDRQQYVLSAETRRRDDDRWLNGR